MEDYLFKANVQAEPCTYQEFKAKYNFQSNEFDDLDRGYAVDLEYCTIFILDYVFEDCAVKN